MKELRDWFYDNGNHAFKWGEWDCALAAADWWRVWTGEHPCPAVIGAYDSRVGSYKYISANADSFADLVTQHIGEPLVSTLQAMTGDIVLYQGENGKTLGVSYSASIIAPGERGLIAIPKIRLNILQAWRIKST